MTTLFKPIRPKKISEEIVRQIRELIAQGELQPGERVPSERELAAMLGVSRPSVREAITVLEAMGLVESRQGGGTFVRSLAEASLADPLSALVEEDPAMLQALVEVRMGLETWSAFLAASRASDQDLEHLGQIFAEMERQAAKGGWDAEVDARFHYTITAATHNTLQMHVLNTVHSLFHVTIQVALAEFYRQDGAIETLRRQHRDIFQAILRRDPEAARRAMLDHLRLVEQEITSLHRKLAR